MQGQLVKARGLLVGQQACGLFGGPSSIGGGTPGITDMGRFAEVVGDLRQVRFQVQRVEGLQGLADSQM